MDVCVIQLPLDTFTRVAKRARVRASTRTYTRACTRVPMFCGIALLPLLSATGFIRIKRSHFSDNNTVDNNSVVCRLNHRTCAGKRSTFLLATVNTIIIIVYTTFVIS